MEKYIYTKTKLVWTQARSRVLDGGFPETNLWSQLYPKGICATKLFAKWHIILVARFKVSYETANHFAKGIFQKEYNKLRSLIINSLGYKICRFQNSEIINRVDEVIKKIKEHCSLPHEDGEGLGMGAI